MSKRTLGRKTLAVIALVIVIVVGGVAGFYYYQSSIGPKVSEVKVGLVLQLSGRQAELGVDAKRGVDFAVDEFNAAGGIKNLGGANITIVSADHAGDPATASAETERLITEEKVVAVLGFTQSSCIKTASEVAERYAVPFIGPDTTNPDLTERGYQYYFRTCAHDVMYTEQQVEFVDYLNRTYGNIRTIAIIYEDTAFGVGCRNAWTAKFGAANYSIVEVISYHAATITSLDSEVQTLKSTNADVVLVASMVADGITFVKTLKAKDYMPKLLLAQDNGFTDPAFKEQVGKEGYYLYTREVFNWDLNGTVPKLEAANQAFVKRFGLDMSGVAARGYVGVQVLYKAIEEAAKKASMTEVAAFRTAIRDALRNIDIPKSELIVPWEGIKFDSKGQNYLATGIIVQMNPVDGKYHTVWPLDIATRDIIYPIYQWRER